MIRNRHLRAEAEERRGIIRTETEARMAELLLKAQPDKLIAEAIGLSQQQVIKRMCVLRKRAGVTNRVGLALALERLP